MVRGRPRKCDLDEVLNAAMTLFWDRGYEATSMNHVSEATGMAKPGLYAAFGNKDALFTKALTRYYDAFDESTGAEFMASGDPIYIAIRRFLESIAQSVTNKHNPCGCFIAKTLAETAGASSPVADQCRALNARRKQALTEKFRLALENGELSPEADPEQIADYILGQSYALALMAGNGADHASLLRFIDVAMAALPIHE